MLDFAGARVVASPIFLSRVQFSLTQLSTLIGAPPKLPISIRPLLLLRLHLPSLERGIQTASHRCF